MERRKRSKGETVDDLTGEIIPDGDVQEVAIRIGGTSWELTLGAKSAARLAAKLAPFLRNVEPRHKRTRAVNNRAVRAWAAQNGIEVGERGRIPERVIQDYLKTMGQSPS